MMWRSRAPPPAYAGHHAIGKPLLYDTTYDEKLLETLPHVREALLLRRKAHENNSTRQTTSTSPDTAQARNKRFSDAPTASSVYTQSPEFAYKFDTVNKVAPLFADRQRPTMPQAKTDIVTKRRLSSIPVPVKQKQETTSRLAPVGKIGNAIAKPLADGASKSDLPGLGIHALTFPANVHEWQGASGGTALMTPITDTPAHSERTQSPSVSPTSERKHSSIGPAISDIEDGPYLAQRPPPPPVPEKSEYEIIRRPVPVAHVDGMGMPLHDVFRTEPAPLDPTAEPLKSRFSWTTKADSELPTTPEQGARPSMDTSWGPSPAQLVVQQQQQQQPQPGSRFSWTTVATTVPPDSSPSRMPASKPPQQETSWSTIASTVRQAPYEPHASGEMQPAMNYTGPKNPYVFEEDTPPLPQQTWTWGSAPPVYSPNKSKFPPDTMYLREEQRPGHRYPTQALYQSPEPADLHTQSTPSQSRSPATALQNPRLRPLAHNAPPLHDSPTNHVRATPLRRKPTPSMLHVTPLSTSLHDPRTPSTPLDPDKDLPPAPPALDSIDLLTSLEADLESLGNRRANLTKLIAALTSLDPLSPISPVATHRGFADIAAVDLAKRRADRERAKAFEAELADVRMREHEVGLRLLKAWKRREENVEAPSALWVRRATK